MYSADIRHQDHAVGVMQRALARDRIPHAYIFHGPDGVGKELLARTLARLLLCGQSGEKGHSLALRMGEGGIVAGCGHCPDCTALAADNHPDFHVVHRALIREHPDKEIRKRKGFEIGVEVLRHFFLDRVALKPARGRWRLFVIREADCITPQAQNAMLKTLEEPPPFNIIILLVSRVDLLLPTTLSRCQEVRFDSLPTEFVAAKLQHLVPSLTAQQAAWYASASAGSIGWAIQAAEKDLHAVSRDVEARLSELHRVNDSKSALQVSGALSKWLLESAKELGEHFTRADKELTDADGVRQGLLTLLTLAARFFAEAARIDCGGDRYLGSVGQPGQDELARDLGALRAARAVGRIAQAERQLDLSVNTQLCVDCLAADLADLRLQPA